MGPRVKALREAMDLSLRDLAERSGVSAPMLSQVERGETSPTLPIAERIAAGLDLTPLAAAAPRRGRARRRHAARASAARRERRGHAIEELTPPLPGQRADVSRHALAAGASTGRPGDPPLHEPGGRETAVVLAGTVEPGDRRQRATTSAAGDSVTFDADLPHHFENTGEREAEFLAVVAAGLRRS